MCPDQQLLSVYLDEELPSPWKEKMEAHLSECPACSEKINSFRKLFPRNNAAEQEMMEAAKDRVWEKLQSRKPIQPFAGSPARRNYRTGFLQRRLSIPIPAAAAAAVVILLMAAFLLRGGQTGNDGLAGSFAAGAQQSADSFERSNFFLAAEEEIPVLPVADIDSVLQYLSSDGSDIIILRMPETRNFSITGEPAIVRAADFQRRQQNTRRHQ